MRLPLVFFFFAAHLEADAHTDREADRTADDKTHQRT